MHTLFIGRRSSAPQRTMPKCIFYIKKATTLRLEYLIIIIITLMFADLFRLSCLPPRFYIDGKTKYKGEAIRTATRNL